MKKLWILLVLLFFLAAFFWLLLSAPPKAEVCFADGSCVKAEVVDDVLSRAQGLSGRDALSKDEGMLFVFEEPGVYGFWMKDMLFSIDMIWLDANKTVIFVEKNAPVCITPICPSFGPRENSLYVVEVNANYTIEHNVSLGQKISFELPGT